jgi:hypothetical protein
MNVWLAWIAFGAGYEARTLRRKTVPLSQVIRFLPMPARWAAWLWLYKHFLKGDR